MKAFIRELKWILEEFLELYWDSPLAAAGQDGWDTMKQCEDVADPAAQP